MRVRPKILILHNIIAPYRLPVFDAVDEEYDTTVWFCKTRTKDRLWSTSLAGFNFKAKVLPVFQCGPFFLNPTLLKNLWQQPFDGYVVGDFPETILATFVTILFARLHRRPVVLWSETTGDEVHYFQWLNPATKWHHHVVLAILKTLAGSYRSVLLRLPNWHLALSGMAQSYLLSKGVPAAKITRGIQVMPSSLLPQPTISKDDSPYAHERVILYVGYLNPRKSVDTLIRAFALLPDDDLRLVIAGSGSEEGKLKRQAAPDSRVQFVGFADDQTKANLYAWSSVFALPTLIDCWGLVINEALHYGVRVVTTTEAGGGELLTPELGTVVPILDVPALAAALGQAVATTPNHLRNMSSIRSDITDPYEGAKPIIQAITAARAL